MPYLQHYRGRLYRLEEIVEVLACLYGVKTVAELYGTSSMRYPNTWKARTILASHRAVRSGSANGLPYGPDWKGKFFETLPDGTREKEPSRTSHPIKSIISDYVLRNRVRLDDLGIACETIRERDRTAWIQYSLEAQRNPDHGRHRLMQAAE